MEDFGGKLRQARERRGISLRQIGMHGNSAGEWCDPGLPILIALESVIVIGYKAARSGPFASASVRRAA